MSTLVVDLSFWNTLSQADFNDLANNGIQMVILRSSFGLCQDTRLTTHLTHAQNAGIPIGFYHWFDPTVSIDRQIDFFISLAKRYKPALLALDFEQWWTDWDAWQQAINGKLPWDEVPSFPPNILSVRYRSAWNRLVAAALPAKLIIYTGTWFINQWCPQMDSWLPMANAWIASYIPGMFQSWAALHSAADNLTFPSHSNLHTVPLWQFTSSFIPNGKRIDVSRFFPPSPDLSFAAWLVASSSYTTPAPQPPKPLFTVVVTAVGLKVHPTHNPFDFTVSDWLKAGDICPIFEEWSSSFFGHWGRTSKGWLNLRYTRLAP